MAICVTQDQLSVGVAHWPQRLCVRTPVHIDGRNLRSTRAVSRRSCHGNTGERAGSQAWLTMMPGTTGAPRWSISHRTTYRYSVAVAFAPHVVRLAPRADSVACVRHELSFLPQAVGVYHYVDEYGNGCARATFGTERSQVLQIESRLEVEPLVRPPPPDGLPSLPWPVASSDTLAPFRHQVASPAVFALGQQLAAECGNAPLAFFDRLCSWLYTNMDRKLRLEGAAQTPDQTLTSRHGAFPI